MVSSEVERQDWAWLIYAGVLVFELLNLFQAGWIWILQGQKLPSFLEFGILSLLEVTEVSFPCVQFRILQTLSKHFLFLDASYSGLVFIRFSDSTIAR